MITANVGQTATTQAYGCEGDGTLGLRGSIPAGMSIDPATGIVTFTPTTAGSGSVEVVCFNGCAPTELLSNSTAAVTLDYTATEVTTDCIEGWLIEDSAAYVAGLQVTNDGPFPLLTAVQDSSTASRTVPTRTTRISDASLYGGYSNASPSYSKWQPWSKDMQYMIVAGNGLQLHNGQNYSHISTLSGPFDGSNSRWSYFADHSLQYMNVGGGTQIYELDVATGITTTIADFASLGFSQIYGYYGGGEGNQSYDGRYIPVILQNGSGWGLYRYDRVANTVGGGVMAPGLAPAQMNSGQSFDWWTVSPSGQFLVTVTYVPWSNPTAPGGTVPNGLNVWNASTGQYLRTYAGSGWFSHTDIAMNTAGKDVALFHEYADPTPDLISWNLDGSGQQVEWGGPTPQTEWWYSGQVPDRPGWAMFGSGPNNDPVDQSRPGWNQVFLIELNGNGQIAAVGNILHETSDPAYGDNPFPSVRRDAGAVLTGSNMLNGAPGQREALVLEPDC